MKDVVVIGVGMTQFGELWDKSLRQIGIEAGIKAVNDANIEGDMIDAIYVGNMSSGRFVGQEHIGPIIADAVGLNNIPATRVESACASGGLAFRSAFMSIASGIHDIVVAAGAEKMTDVGGDEATATLATAADQEWESFHGATFPGLYAMIAKRHMHEYGTTRDQLSLVAVKNHENAKYNPTAQFKKSMTIEGVMKSIMVADPLRLMDCSPISDGAAAVILASKEKAIEMGFGSLIRVAGSGQATDTIALHSRDNITTSMATVQAGNRAFNMAGITRKDISMAEVHDCFTINEIVTTEDLGFFKKGDGGKAVEEGHTKIGGEIPVNTSGGLKGKGHPVGATGIAQVIEIVEQLRGKAGQRQVKGDVRYGLAHNVGGSGATAVVHIMEAI